ncbi:MAG: hypothetical protein BWY74_01309 [Firmicutes bacterium ADurb.Bin419]|nr:MAG: hypothetical protein BWY74_01309 [Firmicutes bacterium ADurb.Bin419]
MKKSLIILIVLLFLSATSFAKETVLDLSCDRNSIAINETVLLTVKAENFSGNMSDIKINGIENFDIVSSGSSKEMQIINGAVSSSQTLQLQIAPKKSGIFKLAAFINQKKLNKTSRVLEISVKEGNQSSSANSQSEREKLSNAEVGEQSFVDSSKLKKSYYFGEKIPLEYNFYTDRQIYEGGFNENWNFSGFISKDLKNDDPVETLYKNKRYLKYNLKKVILTPVKNGDIDINSIKFQVNQISDSGFLGANFYFTPKLKISVKELPAGKPDQFSGVVGKFDIENENFPAKIKLGDSITLKIKLKGEANFDTLEKLPVSENMLYKIYQNQKESSEKIENGKYYAEKTFEIVIVPKNSGVIEIPDIKISYFDTETQTYKFAVIKGENVTVEKNSEITETKLTTATDNKVNSSTD